MVGKMPMRSHVTSAFLAAAFVLAPVVAGHAAAPPKPPFTVTNDPAEGTVVDTMLQRTCTGRFVALWSWSVPQWSVTAIFYRQPDGSKWVKLFYHGIGPAYLPVTELGKSAQFTTPEEHLNKLTLHTQYSIWPIDDNHIGGQTSEPYGSIELTCE
jgi:hypothetical protein